MTPTDTDRFLARVKQRAEDGCGFAAEDMLRVLSVVEGLSRELLVAKAPSVIRGALADVIAERAAQDRKWGEQNHRDACPALLDRDGGVSAQRLADDLEIPSAARARANCQAEFARGQGNWASILVEEVAEAVAAIGEDADLRRELVQVSAVSLAWIEAIDRRSVGAPLVAASGASSAEGSIPSLPCPSSLSSPTPPAPEAAPVPALSSGATGSEGDHGRRRCSECSGDGLLDRPVCPACAGTGFVGVP